MLPSFSHFSAASPPSLFGNHTNHQSTLIWYIHYSLANYALKSTQTAAVGRVDSFHRFRRYTCRSLSNITRDSRLRHKTTNTFVCTSLVKIQSWGDATTSHVSRPYPSPPDLGRPSPPQTRTFQLLHSLPPSSSITHTAHSVISHVHDNTCCSCAYLIVVQKQSYPYLPFIIVTWLGGTSLKGVAGCDTWSHAMPSPPASAIPTSPPQKKIK